MEIKKLIEIADVVDSLHQTPEYTDKGIPMVRVTDVKSGDLSLQDCLCVSEDVFDKFTAKHVPCEGDIVISRVGTYGNFSYVSSDEKFCLGQNTAIIIPHINSRYLYYYLLSPMMKVQIESRVVGSTQKTLSLKNIKDLDIPCFEKSKQDKIASILESIDKKIKNNNRINRNLEHQAESLFKSWFIDFEPWNGIAPNSWKSGTFSELIDSTLGGDWGKDEKTGNFTEKVYCVRGADIPEVKAGNKGKMPTRFILPKNFSSKQLVSGDIVVEISGGSPTQSTGRVASISQSLLDRYDKGMICTNFCRALKPKAGYSMFIYYYWQYLYNRKVFFLYENGTTGIKNLDIKGFLENEKIILPPMDMVNRFDEFCQVSFDQIFKNGISTEKLSETRDVLLPRLMSGELDVANLDL